ERCPGSLAVEADTTLEGARRRGRAPHGGAAAADQGRLRHKTGAEPPLLHPLRGAPDIEVDLVIAEIRGDARATGERLRITAAELERNRMLGWREGHEPRAVAMEHRTGGDHLGIDQGAARQQAMEEPAMPVGPFHHWGDGETVV